MNGAELIGKVNEALDAGKMIAVTTYTRQTRVTAKTRASWRNAGFEFFKVGADGKPLMIEGRRNGRPVYVDFSGCSVKAVSL